MMYASHPMAAIESMDATRSLSSVASRRRPGCSQNGVVTPPESLNAPTSSAPIASSVSFQIPHSVNHNSQRFVDLSLSPDTSPLRNASSLGAGYFSKMKLTEVTAAGYVTAWSCLTRSPRPAHHAAHVALS